MLRLYNKIRSILIPKSDNEEKEKKLPSGKVSEPPLNENYLYGPEGGGGVQSSAHFSA
jgi:hypothetical protein